MAGKPVTRGKFFSRQTLTGKLTGKIPTPGAIAEQQACDLLRQHGLKIRTLNYRTKRGEIDIIAEDNDTLVFVEVRLRSNSAYGSPEESITRHKQQRILYASQHFLQKENINDSRPCRFDTICLTDHNGSPADVQWIKDAFGGGNGW